MKCPKCGYVSHDYLDACRKCSIDLVDFKTQMQLYSIKAGEISLASLLSDVQSNFATSTSLEEPFFSASMFDDTNADDDFDISLDNDLNIPPISMSVADESTELSQFMPPSKPGTNEVATPPDPAAEDQEGFGPPQSGYATIVLDVSNFDTTSPESVSHITPPPTDTADLQEPVDDLRDDLTGPSDTPTHDDPAGSLDIDWDEDPMATVETRAIESPFLREPAEEEPIQMPDASTPLDELASDAYDLPDTDVSRIEFDDTTLSASTSPTEEANFNGLAPDADLPELADVDIDSDQHEVSPDEVTQIEATCTQDLLPDLPDLATDEPASLEPALEADTVVDALEASGSEAVMPDLSLLDAGYDMPQDLSFDDMATMIEEGTSLAQAPEEDAVSQSSDTDTAMQLGVDLFAERQTTDHGTASNDPTFGEPSAHETMIERDEQKSDAPAQADFIMPALEGDTPLADRSAAELDTFIDEDSAVSGEVMPDLPALSFDIGMTSVDSTLVDDVLVSDLGLNLNEDDFNVPSAELPPDAASHDAGESPSEDDDTASNGPTLGEPSAHETIHETMIERDEQKFDAPAQADVVMPALEDDTPLAEPSAAELDTFIDEDSAVSGEVMPDLPALSFDIGMTSVDSTLVDDVLVSDLGLNLNEDDFNVPSAELPPDAASHDAGESPSEDDDTKLNDAP